MSEITIYRKDLWAKMGKNMTVFADIGKFLEEKVVRMMTAMTMTTMTMGVFIVIGIIVGERLNVRKKCLKIGLWKGRK